MIIDTHCHYNLDPLVSTWQEHWNAAQGKGVTQSVVVGTSIETSQMALEIAATEKNLFATIGIHPNQWQEESTSDIASVMAQLKEQATFAQKTATPNTNPKLVAIGETGLDYFRLDKTDPSFTITKNTQIDSLREHIELAHNFDLPVILHVRDNEKPEKPTADNAYWDLAQLVSEFITTNGSFKMILHCVSGPMTYLKTILNFDAYVGVAGNVSYKSAQPIRDLVVATPQNRLVLETDAPYLPPQSYRGQSCQPWMIAETADFVTTLTGTTKDTLIENSQRLFPQLSSSTVQ